MLKRRFKKSYNDGSNSGMALGCTECWDGGSVAKGVQGAVVVPMEAIWRHARTECQECLEC